MKTLKLFALGLVLFISSTVEAQVSVNVNIGTPPSWGPVGYSHVDYYYLPDIQVYYDIPGAQFIYFGNGRWYRSRYLPSRYRNYDLYSGYKVVLSDYHGDRPYTYFKQHKAKYYKGYKGKPQRAIGNRNSNNAHKYNKQGNHGNYSHQGNSGNKGNSGGGHGKGNGKGNH